MNSALAGRSMAGLTCRRTGLVLAAPLRSQMASKTTVAKKGIVGAPAKAARGSTGNASPPPPPAPPPPASATATAGAPAAAGATPTVSQGTRGKNLLFGAVLVGCVGASYFTTIRKMKDQDFLGDVEKEAEEEAQVNLHKSGLKVSAKVVPQATDNSTFSSAAAPEASPSSTTATSPPAEAASEAAAAAAAVDKEVEAAMAELLELDATPTADEGAAKKKKKGWRKYWLFGPRSGGD